MSRQLSRVLLSEVGATPPTEFQLFKPGVNHTTKGDILFDRQAAQQVMSQYQSHGTDIMLDVEHDSLNPSARAMRSDAADAAGWFQLALKPDGSLWAVNVRWNPNGITRLANRTQRYTSPAFTVDENDRPTRLVNVALCAMPATLGSQPLVAASRTTGVVGFRADRATVAAVHALAKARGVTKSQLLIDAITMLAASDTTAPSRAAVAAMNALIKAMGLDPNVVGQDAVLSAIKDVFVAANPDTAAAPDEADPSDVPELSDPAPADAPQNTALSEYSGRPVATTTTTQAPQRQARDGIRPAPRPRFELDASGKVVMARKR